MEHIRDFSKYFKSVEVQKQAKILCELSEECWRLGLSDSTGFSISQVIPNTNIVLVDKSGTGFRRNKITPEDLLLIDLNGNLVYEPSTHNVRKAPVNVIIHLEGYKSSDAQGCIHWHDPYTNAFACYGKTIHPLTLQSKLIGDVPCVMIDDRKEKGILQQEGISVTIPTGLHTRADVYFVMKQVAQEMAHILTKRNDEFTRHGIVITHYEHGLFSFGRHVEEAFDNGYRSVRNAQTILYSQLLTTYPDARATKNAGIGDTTSVSA